MSLTLIIVFVLIWFGFNMSVLLFFAFDLYFHREDEEYLKDLLSEPEWGEWINRIMDSFVWTVGFPAFFTVYTLELLMRKYEWIGEK